jgi:hypothetical protein
VVSKRHKAALDKDNKVGRVFKRKYSRCRLTVVTEGIFFEIWALRAGISWRCKIFAWTIIMEAARLGESRAVHLMISGSLPCMGGQCGPRAFVVPELPVGRNGLRP